MFRHNHQSNVRLTLTTESARLSHPPFPPHFSIREYNNNDNVYKRIMIPFLLIQYHKIKPVPHVSKDKEIGLRGDVFQAG